MEKQKPDMDRQAGNDGVSLELDGSVLDYTYSIFTPQQLCSSGLFSMQHREFMNISVVYIFWTAIKLNWLKWRIGRDDKDCDV